VYSATSLNWPMIRCGRYKYFKQARRDVPVLFDLETDPLESVNLVDEPAYAEIAGELAAQLQKMMSQPVLDVAAPA
jgi:arylsulfatase A-like enzyme